MIIDGSPRVTDLARSAMLASDLVLIPVQPSPYDVWAAEETVKLLEEARVLKEKPESCMYGEPENRKHVLRARRGGYSGPVSAADAFGHAHPASELPGGGGRQSGVRAGSERAGPGGGGGLDRRDAGYAR